MSAALRRFADGDAPLDLADLPYRLQRTIVAARHGCRPADVDTWPAAEFIDALTVLNVG